MNSNNIILFIIGTVFIGVVSRRTLLHPRSHGFYRFFAWESILLITIWNYPFWIEDPFCLQQIFSWLFLTASLIPVVAGTWLLQTKGLPSPMVSSTSEFRFEQTTALVTTGVYQYIRHPLYASLLYLSWGICLKHITWTTTAFTLVTAIFLYATAIAEERENVIHFGNDYISYMKRTTMFIPFIW